MEWSTLVEAVAPPGEPPIEVDDGMIDRFADALEVLHGSAGATERSWSGRVTVDARDALSAARAAVKAVTTAATDAGLPAWPVLVIETTDADRLAAELEIPNFPDIVGAHEALAILGISRQRLHQLREAGRFPLPMVELASGPVWMRAAVESFAARDRRTGRPARVAS